MAPLKRIIILTIGINIGLAIPLFGEEISTKGDISNVFAQDPISPYDAWWRPYKVIMDPNRVFILNQQIKQISLEEASKYDLNNFGEMERTAFLFPILALHEEKGAILLERFLTPYAQQEELDDQWLLIVASLGRNTSKTAQEVLEEEFQRILPKYGPYKYIKVKGKTIKIPTLDARVSVLEALLACMAARQSLTGDEIKRLSRQIKEDQLQYLLFNASLEWGRKFLDEQSLMNLIESELLMCEADDFKNCRDMELGYSAKLSAIRDFLGRSKDDWPLTRKLMIWQEGRSGILFEYLRLQCLHNLIYQAEISQGGYPIDESIAQLYDKMNDSARLSYCCYVLSACKPSQELPGWQSFLKKHAKQISRYKSSADYQIEQIHKEKITDEDKYKYRYNEYITKRYDFIKEPGIYMKGFTGAQREFHRK